MDLFDHYPNISVDFRKLDRDTLEKILKQFNVRPPVQMTDIQLANAVAKIFDSYGVDERDIVDKFAATACYAMTDFTNPLRRGPRKIDPSVHCIHPAALGEQVAAKVSKTDENGAWILANVLGIDPMNEIYEVQDEDDPRRIITLNYGNLRRLTDNASDIRKGDRVLAVFPETTSFYRAVVVKTPKPLTAGSTGLWEVVVKFEDDEDDTGKPPARKVPSRFVIRSSAFAEEL